MQQTCQDYEIVPVREEGSLATLRNKGAKLAIGKFLVFIDDDITASPGWLDAIRSGFDKGYHGVSGRSFIRNDFRINRDTFRFGSILSRFSEIDPGRISKFGMWSLAATNENCTYEGEVNYLEACNMAFEKDAFWSVNGFDESYKGIGDWSEPDLCFRLGKNGYRMWFSRNAVVEHCPSKSGAYKKRLIKCNRMENYEQFSKRWIKPCWQHSLFKMILRGYFWAKENKLV